MQKNLIQFKFQFLKHSSKFEKKVTAAAACWKSNKTKQGQNKEYVFM